ncbi:MAG TPA: glycosyltransferase 87 family protein, partial [Solirubrobacteraceae bacterium]|nr:glycosyltransferase 87 family protein [Solirubrobacteraceae bacterium]
MQAATPVPRARLAETPPAARGGTAGARVPAGALRALASLGLLGVLASALLLAGGAAGEPSRFVPARSGGWPGWLAGPLAGLHLGLPGERFQTLMLIMCGGYALVLAGARTLPARALVAGIVAAHVILVLGPPLLSQDIFGYLAYGRMGALHGLDPYTHFPSEAPADPVFQFLGWPFQHSPYGPLFTLGSYAVAPLGPAAGVWVFKALSALASLAAIALIAAAAGSLGRSRRWAAAFVGLNPVLLALAVGGAHNDTLVLLVLALALLLSTGVGSLGSHYRGAAVTLAAGVGVKVTAALLLPFLALAPPRPRERVGVLTSAALGLLALAVIGLIGFGTHAIGFLGAVGEQQQLV